MAACARTSGVSAGGVWARIVPVIASISRRMIGGATATLCIRHTRLDYKARFRSKRQVSRRNLARTERGAHHSRPRVLLDAPPFPRGDQFIANYGCRPEAFHHPARL